MRDDHNPQLAVLVCVMVAVKSDKEKNMSETFLR